MKTAHGAALRGRMRCFFRSFMFIFFPPSAAVLLHQSLERGERPFNLFGRYAVRDPHKSLHAEPVARDQQELVPFRPLAKSGRVRLGRFDKEIKSAVRLDAVITEGDQSLIQQFPVPLVYRNIGQLADAFADDELKQARGADIAQRPPRPQNGQIDADGILCIRRKP